MQVPTCFLRPLGLYRKKTYRPPIATVVLQLICLLTVVYCFLLSAISPILWSVFIIFSQSFSKPPMPNNNWSLFSESPTFGGTQHYLQSEVKVLHFTR